MSISTHTCLVVSCDTPDCLAYIGEDDEGSHFPTVEAAIDSGEREGWQFTRDGRTARCPDCVRAEVCRISAHQWTGWARRWDAPGHQNRWCRYCGTRQTRLRPDAVTGR
ncbi:hypothetical protein [Actinocatenispora rupis]|uniref:Uncharacterized protein n=1 Tax=Actinocatenispora rupis TaxID=519421 RepID=A0A8J3JCP2_9ACTN|nr:hypothetical protein [Actinocatenispora rupis]GID14067.1 hypothetical protein Aru02nite_49560 [Actinocatenispora rupis]